MGYGRLEVAEIDAARIHGLGGVFVVDQRQQQMFERRIFVAPRTRGFERLVQRGFERGAEDGCRKSTRCTPVTYAPSVSPPLPAKKKNPTIPSTPRSYSSHLHTTPSSAQPQTELKQL